MTSSEPTGQKYGARSVSPRRIRRLWWMFAAGFAFVIPSPFGIMRPASLLLWGLVGDPRSFTEALASIGAGVALLAAYTLAGYLFLRLVIERLLVSPSSRARGGVWE